MGERFRTKLQQLDRLKEILLANPRGLRKAEIARRLDVHRSTVSSYIDDLGYLVPIYEPVTDRFAIRRDLYQVEVLLTLDESVALHLASRLLATRTDKHYPHAAKALRALGTALEEIAPLVSNHLRSSADVLDDESRRRDPVFMHVLETLTKAWSLGRKVNVTHEMDDGRIFEYAFAPYFLEPYAVGRTMHVIGHREPPGKVRTFKLERIRTIRLLDEPYEIPAGFDPREELKNAWGIWYAETEPEEVMLRFDRRVAKRVQETKWHYAEKVYINDKNGSLTWRAPVAAWQEMVPWIRSWGADVEVLAPLPLRHSLEQHALRISKLYGLSADSDMIAYAHSLNQSGERHSLVTHLEAVADMAARFAEPLQAPELARYLGMWHDLGKFHPDFQQYLLDAEAGLRRRGPDHKAAGVRLALETKVTPLMLLLQGHHGGLKNRTDLQQWYERRKDETEQALSIAREAVDFEPPEPLEFPTFVQHKHSAEFFFRMLFSTLVDADFLDTEAHFNPEKGAQRGGEVDMATLWSRFADDQQRHFGEVVETTVNQSRHEIYDACLVAATQPAGLFRLTVPTGGGKTRSGMAFALRHALEHGQRRIVIAVPYITITQQTAGIYRSIFNAAEDDDPAVLEHHSGATERVEEANEYDTGAVWQRLAAENWDAPIIVTTTVQLFESLFANSTSRCRKLHRLANSVIILDEAQSLPAHLLDPMLDALRELCAHYGSTVVLSTATQPAFDTFEPFKELAAREIVPTPEHHFQALKRVRYEWCVDEPMSWLEIAELMRTKVQALAICNTKQDALDLLDALDDPYALHLSTLLCGTHRSAVIKEVRRRLKAGDPCRLVATQVVEAGVDIDFPLVLRAMGPLDSIVQAAGRANREGKLESGRVIIFNPANGSLPPGAYKRAAQTTRTMLNSGSLDMHDPAVMKRFFKLLYQLEETDKHEIQKKRSELDYPEVSRRFRMIDDDTISVVITAYGSEEDWQRVRSILERLQRGAPPTRRLMRKLQPYTVSVWKRQANKYLNQGFLFPQTSEGIAPGIWEWKGEYDAVRGLTTTDKSADKFVF